MNISVKVAAKAASAHTHASQPTERRAVRVGPPRPSRRSRIAKKVNATKPAMYIVSFVAKPSAISAPISAGCQRRGSSRKRNTTTSSARLIAAK